MSPTEGGTLWVKANTVLVPAMDETALWLAKKKNGATIVGDFHEMRNGKFFRKWWSLVKFAFDTWSETCTPQRWRGFDVRADFDVFRRNVTIIAGFCYPVWNVDGQLRLEPESLKWSKMDEDRFGKLYEATLHALVEKIFNGHRCRKYTPDQLRDIHEHIWGYADNWLPATPESKLTLRQAA